MEKEEKYFVLFYDIDKFFKATGFYAIVTDFLLEDWQDNRNLDTLWGLLLVFIKANLKSIKNFMKILDEYNDKINKIFFK